MQTNPISTSLAVLTVAAMGISTGWSDLSGGGRAKALVAHAKGKWIGGAEKGIAEAKEQLKNADGAAARKAAKEALAKWEKNKEEGLVALEERQAVQIGRAHV